MRIIDMDDFQWECKLAFSNWYKANKRYDVHTENVYIVWCVKVLQNFKALVACNVPDGIYAEYTYNGDEGELYQDVYEKVSNECLK